MQAEAEFLLDRNRLNVATTRARLKLIVVAAEPVLRPPLSALSSVASKLGFAHLKALQARAATNRSELSYVIDREELRDVAPTADHSQTGDSDDAVTDLSKGVSSMSI